MSAGVASSLPADLGAAPFTRLGGVSPARRATSTSRYCRGRKALGRRWPGRGPAVSRTLTVTVSYSRATSAALLARGLNATQRIGSRNDSMLIHVFDGDVSMPAPELLNWGETPRPARELSPASDPLARRVHSGGTDSSIWLRPATHGRPEHHASRARLLVTDRCQLAVGVAPPLVASRRAPRASGLDSARWGGSMLFPWRSCCRSESSQPDVDSLPRCYGPMRRPVC